MGLLSSPVEKAQGRLTDIRSDLTAARARLVPDLAFEQSFALREAIGLLERKEAAAADALAFAEDQQAKAAAEAEKAKAGAEVEAYRREAEREMPSRFNKIAKLQEALAAELASVDAHVSRANDMNQLARRLGMPGVVDGETLFRGTPTRTEPAVFEEREVWRDASGRTPSQFRTNAKGDLVPSEAGFEKRRERVQVRAEHLIPGGLPGDRLAESIRLVDVKTGRPQWPVSP